MFFWGAVLWRSWGLGACVENRGKAVRRSDPRGKIYLLGMGVCENIIRTCAWLRIMYIILCMAICIESNSEWYIWQHQWRMGWLGCRCFLPVLLSSVVLVRWGGLGNYKSCSYCVSHVLDAMHFTSSCNFQDALDATLFTSSSNFHFFQSFPSDATLLTSSSTFLEAWCYALRSWK